MIKALLDLHFTSFSKTIAMKVTHLNNWQNNNATATPKRQVLTITLKELQ